MEYKQLSEYERFRIAHLQAAGASQRQIAAALDRAPSTVARELKRNGTPAGRYAPDFAQLAARSRRWRGARLERDAALRDRVLAGFARRWSPQQIAGRLARDAGRRVLCHESIYRFVYRQQARVKDYRWSRCLPQGESERGWRGRGRSSPARFIAQRTPIHQRSLAVATRETFGHWEADLMSFGRSGPVVLALHERASRLLVAVRQGIKGADTTAATLERLLGDLPPAWRQTLTFDNGTEFAGTTASTLWASRPSSATPIPPGRRAAWRTPSAACGARCPAPPNSAPSRRQRLQRPCSCTTIRPGSASATGPPPRSSTTRWCTSNVNPPSRLRGHDADGAPSRASGQARKDGRGGNKTYEGTYPPLSSEPVASLDAHHPAEVVEGAGNELRRGFRILEQGEEPDADERDFLSKVADLQGFSKGLLLLRGEGVGVEAVLAGVRLPGCPPRFLLPSSMVVRVALSAFSRSASVVFSCSSMRPR